MTGRGAERLPRVSRRAALGAAARAIGVRRLDVVAELGGSRRTVVWRVTDGQATYVVKAYRTEDGNTFARESAALSAFESSRAAPRLLGTADDPALVVLADLGDHPSLADAVLGRDRDLALRVVDGWVDAVAALHLAATDEVRTDYRLRLQKAGDQPVHAMPGELEDAVATYRTHAPALRVDFTDEAAAAMSGLVEAFEHESDVLTPADMCPDNNSVVDDRVVLLDFEWAEVRHRAWDVAYLRTPWPTCWCSWRLPEGVAEAAVTRYRERVSPSVPYVGTAAFLRDLDRAMFAWCLVTPAMFLASALGRTEGNEGNHRFPGRRTLILDRLRHSTELPGPESLVRFAGDPHRALHVRWGDHALVDAPAFR